MRVPGVPLSLATVKARALRRQRLPPRSLKTLSLMSLKVRRLLPKRQHIHNVLSYGTKLM